MSFRSAKSLLKIDKVGGLGRPRGVWRILEAGSAAEAVASRGFWSLTGTGRSLQKASRTPCSPQGGRRMTESALNSFSKRTDVAMKSVYVKSLSFGSFLWSGCLGTVGI